MTTKESIAASLTGHEYRTRIPKAIEVAAREAGLIIVYGASDDLMEFRGAINEELSAWEGTTVLITRDGLFDNESCPAECRYFKQAQAVAATHGQTIDALWDPGDGYSWRYSTTIPHVTFEITEDGEPYCRGIVFALADVEQGVTL